MSCSSYIQPFILKCIKMLTMPCEFLGNKRNNQTAHQLHTPNTLNVTNLTTVTTFLSKQMSHNLFVGFASTISLPPVFPQTIAFLLFLSARIIRIRIVVIQPSLCTRTRNLTPVHTLLFCKEEDSKDVKLLHILLIYLLIY